MTETALIAFARCYDSDLVAGPVKHSGSLYARDGLRWLPAASDVPLVVDHDPSREIGRVTSISVIHGFGGRWWAALATVTKKPYWLKRGTGASFEFIALHRMELNGWDFVRSAIVREVTVTSPSHEPRDPGAKVLTIGPSREKPAAEGVMFHERPGTIIRRNVGQVLAVGGRAVRTIQGDPVRYVGNDIIIDRADGSQDIYCGREGRAEAIRDGFLVR